VIAGDLTMRFSAGKFTFSTITAILLGILMFCVTATSAAQARRLKQQNPAKQQRREEMREDRLRDRAEANPRKQMGQIFGGGIQVRLWARLLKLNEDQIMRMSQLRRRSMDAYIDLETQIRQKRQALERAIFSESFNEEETKQLADELARLEGQRVMMRSRIQSQLRQMLTPDQIRTYNEIRFGQPGSPPAENKSNGETDPEDDEE
jgi:Spy/CpxP family protein refolding chaperone